MKEQDKWSHLTIVTTYQTLDGMVFEVFEEALEHEKSINVRARHRGALPLSIREYISTDGVKWTDYYEARKRQEHLGEIDSIQRACEMLWGEGLNSADDLKNAFLKHGMGKLFPGYMGMPVGSWG